MRLRACKERRRLAEESMRLYHVFVRRKYELEQAKEKESRRHERGKKRTTVSAAERRFGAACDDLAAANLLFLQHCEQHNCVIKPGGRHRPIDEKDGTTKPANWARDHTGRRSAGN